MRRSLSVQSPLTSIEVQSAKYEIRHSSSKVISLSQRRSLETIYPVSQNAREHQSSADSVPSVRSVPVVVAHQPPLIYPLLLVTSPTQVYLWVPHCPGRWFACLYASIRSTKSILHWEHRCFEELLSWCCRWRVQKGTRNMYIHMGEDFVI